MADLVTRMRLDSGQFESTLNKSTTQIRNYRKNCAEAKAEITAWGSRIMAIAAPLGVAGSAVGIFSKLISSSQATGDEWAKTLGSAKGQVDAFFTAMATGDFTAFDGGVLALNERLRETIDLYDQLGNAQISYSVLSAKTQAEISESRSKALDKSLGIEDRKKGFEDWQKAIAKLSEQNSNLAADMMNAIKSTVTNDFNGISSAGITEDDIYRIFEVDLSNNVARSKFKKDLEERFKEYSKTAADIRRKHEGEFVNTGDAFISNGRRGGASMDHELKKLQAEYRDVLLANKMLVKMSDEELKGIGDMMTQQFQLRQAIANTTTTYNKSFNTFLKEGNTPTGASNALAQAINIDAPSEVIVDKQIDVIVNNLNWKTDSKKGFDNKDLGLTISKRELPNKMPWEVESNNIDQLLQIQQIMGGINGAILGSSENWMQFTGNMLTQISQLIPMLSNLFVAQSSVAISSAASVPFPLNIAAMAGTAGALISTIASIPKFAAGGIVYGDTLARVGEYPGASSNPEVIAPLNKLRSLIQPDVDTRGQVQEVRFKLSGRELEGVLKAHEQYKRRIR